jgi:hypothetical protein
MKSHASNDCLLAHEHSANHFDSILSSEICGCFYCLELFPPDQITEFIDYGQTALCPHCKIDSVIGSASGFPINSSFLSEMKGHWFYG